MQWQYWVGIMVGIAVMACATVRGDSVTEVKRNIDQEALDPRYKPNGKTKIITPNAFSGTDSERINQAVVAAAASGGHHIVRLLNTRGLKLYDILIDGVIDTSVDNPCRAVVRIGSKAYGGMTPIGDTARVIIRNVFSRGHHAVLIAGSLTDSIIDGVIQQGANGVTVEAGDQFVRNVSIQNVIHSK